MFAAEDAPGGESGCLRGGALIHPVWNHGVWNGVRCQEGRESDPDVGACSPAAVPCFRQSRWQDVESGWRTWKDGLRPVISNESHLFTQLLRCFCPLVARLDFARLNGFFVFFFLLQQTHWFISPVKTASLGLQNVSVSQRNIPLSFPLSLAKLPPQCCLTDHQKWGQGVRMTHKPFGCHQICTKHKKEKADNFNLPKYNLFLTLS